MRLVCPNCEAKYEVPEDAIPETGRDVQCANCGHAWYQMRQRAAVAEPAEAAPAAVVTSAADPVARPTAEPEAVSEPAAEAAAPAPEVPSADTPALSEPGPDEAAGTSDPEPEMPVEGELADAAVREAVADLPSEDVAEAVPTSEPLVETVAPEPETTPESEPETAPEPEPEPELAATKVPEAPATGEGVADAGDHVAASEATPETTPEITPETEAASAEPAAYAVDDSVLAILREEAEREAQARRAEVAPVLETQADLGIDAALPGARMAVGATAAAGLALDAADEAADRAAGRRTRLPDVEEINSTLRPSESLVDHTLEPAALPEVEPRSSFRSGFLLVLTIAILASALYISADALARAVPSLAGMLESYVSFINSLRLQMDGLMQSATVAINGTGG